MKKITRTFESHTITGATVAMENGKIVTTPLKSITVFNETMNKEKALKLLRKTYGKNENYVLLESFTTSDTYEMDVEEFLKYATVVVGKETE